MLYPILIFLSDALQRKAHLIAYPHLFDYP